MAHVKGRKFTEKNKAEEIQLANLARASQAINIVPENKAGYKREQDWCGVIACLIEARLDFSQLYNLFACILNFCLAIKGNQYFST